MDFFTETEIKAILDAFPPVAVRTRRDDRDELEIRLGLECAAKASDVLALKFGKFDKDRRLILVKGSSRDEVPIEVGPELFHALVNWAPDRTPSSSRVLPVSSKSLERTIQRWAEKAGITRPVYWGMLKNTAIMRLVKRGKPLSAIAHHFGLKAATLKAEYSSYRPTAAEIEMTRADFYHI